MTQFDWAEIAEYICMLLCSGEAVFFGRVSVHWVLFIIKLVDLIILSKQITVNVYTSNSFCQLCGYSLPVQYDMNMIDVKSLIFFLMLFNIMVYIIIRW